MSINLSTIDSLEMINVQMNAGQTITAKDSCGGNNMMDKLFVPWEEIQSKIMTKWRSLIQRTISILTISWHQLIPYLRTIRVHLLSLLTSIDTVVNSFPSHAQMDPKESTTVHSPSSRHLARLLIPQLAKEDPTKMQRSNNLRSSLKRKRNKTRSNNSKSSLKRRRRKRSNLNLRSRLQKKRRRMSWPNLKQSLLELSPEIFSFLFEILYSPT